MIRDLLLYFLLTFILASCSDSNNNFETIIPSSDAQIHLYFNLNEGEPYYLVYFNNDILIDWSMLGFVIDDTINFYESLALSNFSSGTGFNRGEENSLEPDILKGAYNEISFNLEKENNDSMQLLVMFRVYNNAVAYKYSFQGLSNKLKINEITQLDLYPNTFTKVLIKKEDQDSLKQTLIPLEQLESIDIPAIFVSKKGYKLNYIVSKSGEDVPTKLKRRRAEKAEYQIEGPEIGMPFSNSKYETTWRIIYIPNNLN